MLLQVTAALLQITTMCYYKYGSFIKLLQITAAFGVITNYGNNVLQIRASITNYGNNVLQITTGITNYDVLTNYVVTTLTVNSHTLLLLFFP